MFQIFEIFNHYILIVLIHVECIFYNPLCNWKLSKQTVCNNNIVTPADHFLNRTECLPEKIMQSLSIIRSQMLKKDLLSPICKTWDCLLRLTVILAFDYFYDFNWSHAI